MPEPGLYVPEDLGMHPVLGIENADDVTPARRQGCVEGLRLALRAAAIDQDPDSVGERLARLLSDVLRTFVVVADHDQDLHVRVVDLEQRGECVCEDAFFVPRRHDE